MSQVLEQAIDQEQEERICEAALRALRDARFVQ